MKTCLWMSFMDSGCCFTFFPKFLFGRVVVLVVKVAIEGQSMRPRYETKYLNRFVCSTHIPLQFVVVVASAAGIVSLTVSLWKENGRKKKVVSRDGIRLRVYFLNFGFMLCTVDGARQLQLATGNWVPVNRGRGPWTVD